MFDKELACGFEHVLHEREREREREYMRRNRESMEEVRERELNGGFLRR